MNRDPQDGAIDVLVNIEAEAALLGAMLLDNKLIPEIAERLRPGDFAEPLHGRIFNVMLRFSAKGASINTVTLRPIFANDQDAEGGVYLEKIADSFATTVGAGDFADQIIDLANRRVARDGLKAAVEQLETNFEETIPEITSRADQAVFASVARSEPVETMGAQGMVGVVRERVERVAANHGEAPGATCKSIEEVNKVLGPVEGGTLTYAAGRPSMGKTALATSMAWGYAANGHAVTYLHAEGSREALAMRLVADLSLAMGCPLPHDRLKAGNLTMEEWQYLERVEKMAEALPIRFHPVGRASIDRCISLFAREKAYWEARGRKLAIGMIDGIQLLTAYDRNGRELEDRSKINKISETFLAACINLDFAAFGFTQLSRAVDQRVDKRPFMSDLKESGRLEEDADNVLLIHREEYYLERAEPKKGTKAQGGGDAWEEWHAQISAVRNKVDLIGAKTRGGKVSTRTAKFIGEHYAIRGADHFIDSGFGAPEPMLMF